MPGSAAGQPGLVHQRPVAHRDQPVGGGRDPRVVRDDDQRLPGSMKTVEQPQHVEGCGAVEIAGGLVSEDDQRIVGQRAGNRDPLPLPPGQRRGQERRPVGQEPAAAPPAASGRPAARAARHSRRQ